MSNGNDHKATAEYAAIDLCAWVSRDGRIISLWSGQDITEPLRLSEQNGTTLRHALKAHGLPVSGNRRQQAVRLANAGVTAEHVIEHHGWRARQAESANCTSPVSQVHNHPPYRPSCNERHLPDGQLRGACLNDDGSDR